MPLNAQAMHAGAQALVGELDFSAFRSVQCQAKHARRDLHDIVVTRRDDEVLVLSSGGVISRMAQMALDVPDPDQPRDHLLVCADRALYSAKDEGRNAISLARTRALAAEQAAPWRFAVIAKTTNNPSPFVLSLSKDLVQETKASTSSARTGVGWPDYGVLLYTPRPLNQSETPRCRLPSRGR